jgi:uncharacterized membrane protein YhfC
MLYITYSINILLLISIPVALGVFLVRKFDLEGRWWWIGAIVYIISQAILLPIQNYVLNPYLYRVSYSGALPSIEILIIGGLLLGLLTGVCEELLRYAMFRWWTKDARTIKSGFLLGTGHGGAASIFLGLMVLYNFLNMVMYRNIDLTTLVPLDQAQMLQTQISAFWSAPWYYTLREVIGQIFMLIIQISLAVMILQTFVRKQWYWVLLAISFHAAVEAARVITLNLSNEYLTNGILCVFAVISVGIILTLLCPKPLGNVTSGGLSQTKKSDQAVK